MSDQWMASAPEASPANDGQLVLAVLAGDRSAFDDLVRQYQRPATSLAFRLLGDAQDALDVVQESFMRAYRKLPDLTEPQRFRPWLLRIVANQALNYRRARKLRRTASLESRDQDDTQSLADRQMDPHAPRPDEQASANETDARIAAELHRLPEKQRLALVLFSIEHVPQKEVAQILEISVEAVKWHVFTARKKLKEALSDCL